VRPDTKVLSTTIAEAASVLDCDPLTARHSRSLRDLNERLKAQRLHLAVLGQFKRGKSTFLNALLGIQILPTAVVPLTSIPTFISWWPQSGFRIQFGSSEPPREVVSNDHGYLCEELARYVAEEKNPANILRVSSVDVGVPAPLLAGENVLIDTPGIGSTHRHNTDATLRALPQYDAAVVVLSPDPPITDAEVTFLLQLDARIEKTIFVMNKMDTIDEADRKTIERFLRSVLADKVPRLNEAPIFSVSSRDALEAKLASDQVMLEQSGMIAVEEYLDQYVAIEKAATLRAAIQNKAKDVLLNASDEIALRLRTFEMPLRQLEERVGLFSEAIRNAEDHRLILPDLIAGRKRRIVSRLEEEIVLLRAEAEKQLGKYVVTKLAQSGRWDAEAAATHATAIEDYFEAAQRNLFAAFSAELDEALSFLQAGIDSLLASVRRSAEDLFGMEFHRSAANPPLEIRSEPYWVSAIVNLRLMPNASSLARYLVPTSWRNAWLQARLLRDTKELVLQNAENLRWSLVRTFDEIFLRASTDLQCRVEDVAGSLRHVVTSTLEQRSSQQTSVESDVERLKKLKFELNGFCRVLGGI
jgi:GTP-binding protein EngB required for normal cell division